MVNIGGISVDIDMPNMRIEAEKIDELGFQLKSFKEPLNRAIRTVLIPSIKKNFASNGRPRWASLSDKTVQRKGSATPILNETGKLKTAAQQINNWSIDKEEAKFTGLPGKVEYGEFHLSGTRKMPARPFIMMQSEDVEAIEDIFVSWYNERMERVGL